MIRLIERCFWVSGAVLLTIYLVARLDSAVSSRSALAAFDAVTQSAGVEQQPTISVAVQHPKALERVSINEHDQALWSTGRRAAYMANASDEATLPIAVLTIPSIQLKVPVFSGTGELQLNRGAGHVTGTSQPGKGGNTVIAGHRDGFFRVLKDIEIGSRMTLLSVDSEQVFQVTKIFIVDQSSVEVLEGTDEDTLTLITCFPFYFVGNAPRRYIVRGVLASRQ